MEYKNFDVFISYPHKDSAEVDIIYDVLTKEGLRVWMDRVEIEDFDSISRTIEFGLARSKVLIAYYSKNYLLSRACQYELTAAYITAMYEGKINNRVLAINPEDAFEHIHPIELKDALVPGFSTDDAAALDRFAKAVKTRVEGISSFFEDIHYFKSLKPPSWYVKRRAASNRFIGRQPEMWQIHSGLNASGFPMITGGLSADIVQVYGLGGEGKSLLAEEYALRYGSAYPGGVFWLNALGNDESLPLQEREADLHRQVREFAKYLGVTVQGKEFSEVSGEFIRKLESEAKPFLWIVDDMPTGTSVEDFGKWFAPHSLGKTLITTRENRHSAIGKTIHLNALAPDDAYELLTRRRKPEGLEEEEVANEICKDLGWHALSIELAGAWLEKHTGDRPFAEYHEDLKREDNDTLELARELKAELPNGHDKSIARTLLKSIRELKPAGLDLLRLASFLAQEPVPVALVKDVFMYIYKEQATTSAYQTVLAIDDVETLSIAKRVSAPQDALLFHAIVTRTFRFLDKELGRRKALKDASIESLSKIISEIAEDSSRHKTISPYVPHAHSLTKTPANPGEVMFMGWVARYYNAIGDYWISAGLYDHQWHLLKVFIGEEHIYTLASMNNLAGTLYAQGDLPAARRLQEKAYEISHRVLGEEHLETLGAMNNLAQIFFAQGALPGAHKLQGKVLEVSRKVLGEEHPKTLVSMGNLAQTLKAQGDLPSSRTLEEKVLEVSRKVLGEEHPGTLRSMNNLAQTLYAQDNLQDARKLQEKVLEVSRKKLGDEHPNTITPMNNLAITQHKQGDLPGARKLQEKVLEVSRKVLGEEHPETLSALSNLAQTFFAQGDFPDARKLQEKVVEARRKVLGEKHPKTFMSLNNLAGTLYTQGDLPGARKLQEKVLEVSRKVLGDEHPDTVTSAWGLYIILDKMKISKEAQSVLKKHLLWLLERDPSTLHPAQRQIREQVKKRTDGGA